MAPKDILDSRRRRRENSIVAGSLSDRATVSRAPRIAHLVTPTFGRCMRGDSH
jgi:hypothetical protein